MAKFGILVGGGPAPGINGVIGSATILARRSGAAVVRTMVDAEMVGIERFFESLGFQPASLRPFVKQLGEGEQAE